MGIRKMSIQEALNELKVLDNRIASALAGGHVFGAVVVGDRTIRGYKSNEEFSEKVKSNFQSIKALMDRRVRIKGAVIKKNAEVLIDIAGETLTLAEVINKKAYIEADKRLLYQLERNYNSLISDYTTHESRYKQRLDDHIENMVGKDQKDKMKANEDVLKYFAQNNEPHFLDPIGLKDVIDNMRQHIEEFESKVDYALTRANITNDIEFEDPTVEDSVEESAE